MNDMIFEKAWSITKGNVLPDDNETSMEFRGEPLPEGEQLCDGLSIADTGDNNCQGDGLLGEDGGYECSSCGNLHCPECHHHYSLEAEQEDFGHRINFKNSGLEFSLGTDVDSALDHAGLGDASNICGHCIENRVPGAIEEYIDYVHEEVAAEEEQNEDEKERDEEFNQRVDQAPFFGDNRGETLFNETSPHLHAKFNPNWQDTMKSKDSFEMAWSVIKNTNYSVYNADKTTQNTELKPLKLVNDGEQARGSKSPANVKRHEGASNNGKLGDKRDKNMGGKTISNVDKKIKQRERV